MRINFFCKYIGLFFLLSCNMSDYSEEIINGYQYNFEARDECANSIMDSENRIENFGVYNINYNSIYISYSVVDSLFCEKCQNCDKIDTLKSKHYIINTKTHLKIGPLSREKYDMEKKRLNINEVFNY